ncbi:hypothetical protein HDV01_004653 [Terramyces sp. JEL0728]|nr:hypothetical protein HDV01_004653 [Terramyces sp. JEL0728]
MEQTLHDDAYLTLTDKHVVIKYFYFPLGLSTYIPYEDIQKVGLANEAFELKDRIQYKAWGMGLSSVWWSLDMSRAFKWQGVAESDHLVIETKNGLTKAGCTLQDRKVIEMIKDQMKDKPL